MLLDFENYFAERLRNALLSNDEENRQYIFFVDNSKIAIEIEFAGFTGVSIESSADVEHCVQIIRESGNVPSCTFLPALSNGRTTEIKTAVEEYGGAVVDNTYKIFGGRKEYFLKTPSAIGGVVKKFVEGLKTSPTEEISFIDPKSGAVVEGRFTEYCKQRINYILLQSRGRENAQPYIWQNGVYSPISANDFKGIVWGLLPVEKRRQATVSNTFKNLCNSAEKKFDFDVANADERLINFKNGILNLDSGELTPHERFAEENPDFVSTIQIDSNFNSSANCPITKKFLRDLQTKEDGKVDENGIELLWEILGLTISNLPIMKYIKAAVILYSRTTNTGKSKFIELAERLVGSENFTQTDLQSLTQVRFATADLYGKRLGSDGEMKRFAIDDVSTLMKITGYDSLSGERKGKDSFKFRFKGALITGNLENGEFRYYES